MSAELTIDEKLAELEEQVRVLEGRLRAIERSKPADIEKQNLELAAQVAKKERDLVAQARTQGRDTDTHDKILKQSAVEYSKNAKVDPELWKSLES